jgi:hypothetical protein
MACATLRYQTILSGKYIFYHSQKPIFPQKHPENPLILDILIWLAPRFAIRQFYQENIFSIIHKNLYGQELIFDNIHPEGISRVNWINNLYCVIQDLGGEFQITETEF